MEKNLYRKKGPKVFVSYSYKDKKDALQLRDYLTQNSFTVQIEDETSLLGEDLNQILPKRIGDSEVFIVLLTKTSNNSNWVKSEFQWAIQQKKENNLLVIPVVLEESNLPDFIKSWVYLNASNTGLTRDLLNQLKEKCSTAILPISIDSTGYKFRKEIILSLVKEGISKKRVVLDSDGVLYSLFDDLFASINKSKDPMKDYFLKQEDEYFRDTQKKLNTMDELFPLLVDDVLSYTKYYPDAEELLDGALEIFSRLVIGRIMIHLSQMVLSDDSVLWKEISTDFVKIHDDIMKYEKARSHYGIGFYAWVYGILDRSDDEIQPLHFLTKTNKSVPLLLPKSMLGKSWERIAHCGDDPREYLPTTSWAINCIPQFMSFVARDVIDEQISVKEAHDRYFWPFEPDKFSAFNVIKM